MFLVWPVICESDLDNRCKHMVWCHSFPYCDWGVDDCSGVVLPSSAWFMCFTLALWDGFCECAMNSVTLCWREWGTSGYD